MNIDVAMGVKDSLPAVLDAACRIYLRRQELSDKTGMPRVRAIRVTIVFEDIDVSPNEADIFVRANACIMLDKLPYFETPDDVSMFCQWEHLKPFLNNEIMGKDEAAQKICLSDLANAIIDTRYHCLF